MRHQKTGRKLSRPANHRRAMFKNMVTSLITHERLQTTDAKAKELRRLADKMITLGKRGDLHARRRAARLIGDKDALAKLFSELGPRYQDRAGGYTRIIKVGRRQGDDAPISLIELVDSGILDGVDTQAEASE